MEVTQQVPQERVVSGGFSLDTKEQVRQAIDIVDLVGSYIQLRRQGRGYVGLCPWHDDSRPSLQVNPDRQSWKCWVCDLGGDIFSFIMQIEGVEFREALEMLAERAGIEMQPRRAPQPEQAESPQAMARDRKTLFRAMAWAEGKYHRCLLEAPEAEPARQYLKRRGINAESIARFHLGFSSNANWILGQAKGGTAPEAVLEAINVIEPRDDGSYYDRFHGRLLFSIRDAQGRPVAIGGRVLPETGSTSRAKYVNSRETALFTKSKLLYGLDIAKDSLRRVKEPDVKTALVMEGYTDVIMAHQYGFDNAVAVLGTALGPTHVQILKRFADRVVLVLDGDEAGQKRTAEVLELFVAQDVDLRILTLPEGNDPCDYLEEHGADAFHDLLNRSAVDAVEHAFRHFTRGVDLTNDVHGASQSLEQMVGLLAKAPRPTGPQRFREEKILSRLATSFGVSEEDIRGRLVQLRRQDRRPVYTSPSEAPPMREIPRLADLHKRAPGQCELLELVVAFPELLPEARGTFAPERITEPSLKHIYATSCRLADEGETPGFDRLMLEFDRPELKNLLIELADSPRIAGVSEPEPLLKELIQNYERIEFEKQHPSQLAALKDEGLDESQKTDLLQEMMEKLRARHGISDPTDG